MSDRPFRFAVQATPQDGRQWLAAWDAHSLSPIFVVGDEAPAWVQRFLQADLATLVERDSLLMLRGSPRQMADELLRRRNEIGVSYHSVNAAFCEQFAPVVELLAGG